MKKTILITSLFFCTLNIQIYAQSTTEDKNNASLGTTVPDMQADLSAEQTGVNIRQKKRLTLGDYDSWEALQGWRISDNGEWISYVMRYQMGKDSLFLKNVNTGLVYNIPDGNYGAFSSRNNRFAYKIRGKGIGVIDIKTGQRTLIQGATKYNFTANGNYLAIYTSKNSSLKEAKQNTLLVQNLVSGTSLEIENVSEYGFNKEGDQLVYFAKDETSHFVALRHLRKDKEAPKILTSNPKNGYHRLTWDKEGSSFAFLEAFKDSLFQEESNIVHHYRQKGKRWQLYSFDHRKNKGFPKEMYVVSPTVLSKFLISKDTQRVFFEIAPKTSKEQEEVGRYNKNDSDVQIWHWKDKEVYQRKQFLSNNTKTGKLSVWWPATNRFMQIVTKEHMETFLTGNQMYALTFNPQQYRPLFIKYKQDYFDIYITDLVTGKKELFLEKQLNGLGHTLTSPGGNYISYFKDRDWYVYDIKTKTHTNITKNLPYPTYQEKDMFSRSPQPYGNPGWIINDQKIIVQDQYDVWLLTPDGTSQKKLTNGRPSKTEHRVYKNHGEYVRDDFSGFDNHSFNLDKNLLMSTYGEITKKSGYSVWGKREGLREIAYGDKHMDYLRKAKNKESYIIGEQRFDTPKKLTLYSGKDLIKKTLVRSNPQHAKFHWGRSELIEYSGIDEDTLQGALFYPANYEPGKKYPMVVYLYGKLTQKLHNYVNPSLHEDIGFSPTIYTINGYFVLYPDIEYEYNVPGTSAKKCLVSAVEQVLERGLVDRKKIGLLGHSYGGFITSLMITQTDLFSAAVAGAAPVDFVSYYLGYSKGYKKPQLYFYENSQYYFTGSFYEYPDAYLRNSPIHNLQNVHTPLLSWFGAKDLKVPLTQGIEMYNAMRRLEKEHVFLVYPNGRHVLSNTEDKIDLTTKTLHWFDHKLKGVDPLPWILNGTGSKRSPLGIPSTRD